MRMVMTPPTHTYIQLKSFVHYCCEHVNLSDHKKVNNQHISAAEMYQGTLEGSAGLGYISLIFSPRVCVETREIHIHMHTYKDVWQTRILNM